ncbi:UNVERIFIED_CONTAM: hypothetical protein Slati_3055900 [Sesamum latifolium]|uniref:DUF4218 domain-containing protein n=1 Tax=Sesamum latifolium TaxID=2727402 RepID=A0AAW2UVR8_9LAMI
MPRDHTLPLDYYNTKKLIKDLGLPMEKIDACKNGCLYWKDDIDLDYCKFCGGARYKPTRVRNPNRKNTPYAVLRYLPITPRLQRLYVSKTTAEQMTWHATHQIEEGSMCHPSDAEAWRHFDRTHPDFAAEPHNVRLGLCTDGFAPHGQYGRTFLRGLKMKVKNKAHVEASIVEAYLVEEIGLFTSQYFEPQVLCKRNRPAEVTTFPCYFVNGYNFQPSVTALASQLSTTVCVKSSSYTDTDSDFYGILEEAVCKIKVIRVIDDSRWTEVAFQEDETVPTPQVLTDEQDYELHDPNGIQLVFDPNQEGVGMSHTARTDSDDEFEEESFEEGDYETKDDNNYD